MRQKPPSGGFLRFYGALLLHPSGAGRATAQESLEIQFHALPA
jgi:hypothetical protein